VGADVAGVRRWFLPSAALSGWDESRFRLRLSGVLGVSVHVCPDVFEACLAWKPGLAVVVTLHAGWTLARVGPRLPAPYRGGRAG